MSAIDAIAVPFITNGLPASIASNNAAVGAPIWIQCHAHASDTSPRKPAR